MGNLIQLSVCSVVLFLTACAKNEVPVKNDTQLGESASIDKRPNILLIVADDLGFSDLGVYGGEIGTPNLDDLAVGGIQFTSFHTSPTCSPTRAMLMSGTDSHLAGLGNMAEALDFMTPELKGKPGYEGYLNERVAALPEVLKASGYRTYMTGKWHLGTEDHASPFQRGFQQTFTMLEGGAGHLDGRSVINMAGREDALFRQNGVLIDAPKSDFYSTQFYTETLIDFLSADQASDQPFFAYLAYTAPHWPLQAPEASIARFEGRYDAGYQVLFDERFARQKELGLVAGDVPAQRLIPGTVPWANLNADEQKAASKEMEVYAAMVRDMDEYVGKLIEALKDLGEYENTVIFFMSDNGTDGTRLEFMPNFEEYLAACCDNSLENMGKANSFLAYGPGWARAGASPSWLSKSQTAQGGILAPAILFDPRRTGEGYRYDEFVSVKDVMPTLLELAAVEPPKDTFAGREVLPIQGKSMASLIDGINAPVHQSDYEMGFELMGQSALRKGDWKLVMVQPPMGTGQWLLFNIKDDPLEMNDLSEEMPDKREELIAAWDRYVRENGVQPVSLRHPPN